MSLFEEIPALSPVQFFGMHVDCHYIEGTLSMDPFFQLPSTADLLAEESFADLYVGWNLQSLQILAFVKTPFQGAGGKDFRKEDSLEIFIDTRDLKARGVKTTGAISKFCHHFLFFPVQVQNFYGREITRFRNEDVHRLCHPEDLQISTSMQEDGYLLTIEIPSTCLYGYDPLSFPRLGFTYRINRTGGAPQHFVVSSEEYAIELHPSTWGTLNLCRR